MLSARTRSASNAPNEEVELTGDYITDGASYFRTQATNVKSWDELISTWMVFERQCTDKKINIGV